MAFTDQLLVRVLQSSRGKPLSVDDVLLRGGIDPGEKVHVRRALRRLVKEGHVELAGKRYRIPPPPPEPEESIPTSASPPSTRETATRASGRRGGVTPATAAATAHASVMPTLPERPSDPSSEIVGTLTIARQGYGFIRSLHGGVDAFVPPHLMQEVLDGDLVRARLTTSRDGRFAARSLEVLEHRRRYAVGTYRERARLAWVEPRDEELGTIRVSRTQLARDGEVVRVRIDGREEGDLRGVVDSRLGRPGDPDVEVLSVAYGEGFSDVFPPDTLAAAKAVPEVVRDADREGRRDLTGLPLVTIDGEDARDFDDAVYVERNSRGYRLVVAIADVSAYVPEGGALDAEALRRATSVYFPRHVLPMLPERLSNGICSLNPDVDRLCMVADMMLDGTGAPMSADLYPGVMRSHARCTYTQVSKLMNGEAVPELAHVSPMLEVAAELSQRMTAVRMARGAIDFDIPEAFVVLDDDGAVADIVKRERTAAHRLIEEFMLAANEAVARHFEERSLPTVFRVHGEPDPAKLESFVTLANVHGFELTLSEAGQVDPLALNDFLRRLAGHREQRALNHLLLRAMMQAIYSAENIGHFGLAAPSYLHFTSPIRRYPDLVVHRLLKAHWARGGKGLPEQERLREEARLEATAAHCSERERAAMSASREIAAYYAASLMVRHVGEQFRGTVSAVTDFGFFVELEAPFVEGLVRAETLGIDWELDSELHRLVFPVTGRTFSVGAEVEVEVMSANPVSRRIDLRLVSGGAALDAKALLSAPKKSAKPASKAKPTSRPKQTSRKPTSTKKPSTKPKRNER